MNFIKSPRFSLVALSMSVASLCLASLARPSHAQFLAGTNGNGGNGPQVGVLVVDSSSAPTVKVQYRVAAGTIKNVSFSAPGVTGQSLGSKSSNFTATFDQRDVPVGNSPITLSYSYDVGTTSKPKTLTFSANRSTSKSAQASVFVLVIGPPSANQPGGGVMPPYMGPPMLQGGTHTLRETDQTVIYHAKYKLTNRITEPQSCNIDFSCSKQQKPNTVGIIHKYFDNSRNVPTQLQHAAILVDPNGPNETYASEGVGLLQLVGNKFVSTVFLEAGSKGQSQIGLLFTDSTDSIIATSTVTGQTCTVNLP